MHHLHSGRFRRHLKVLSHLHYGIRRSCWHSLLFFALCLVFQRLLRNVDDSSGGVPLGTAFLPPLPTPGFAFF